MSLMGTLAKVAVGVAVAKGASKLMNNMGNRGNVQPGGLFGGAHSPAASSQNPMDMISGLLGGGQAGASGHGGLGGILEGLTGGAGNAGGLNNMLGNLTGGNSSSGLGNMLGGLMGQSGGASLGASGGLGSMLGGLAGAAGIGGAAAAASGSFGSLLNQAIGNKGEPEAAPSPDQEALAGLFIAAMVQAAKSDGNVDKEEFARFTKNLGEIDPQEEAFLRACLEAEVDVERLVSKTPDGMGAQVYTMSVLAIDLDQEAEAKYLHELATGFALSPEEVNNIHDQLGAPRIYN